MKPTACAVPARRTACLDGRALSTARGEWGRSDEELELANTLPSTAMLMFDEARFDEWMLLTWDLRLQYVDGELATVYPCMSGEFFVDGVKYNLAEPKTTEAK